MIGWYCVWKYFLCRFSLVRELLKLNEQKTEKNSAKVVKVRPAKID